MTVKDQVCVVTGGANGIGRALAERFAAEGARAVVVADLDLAAAQRVAGGFGGMAIACDVAVEADLVKLMEAVESAYGPIGLFCSNAGIGMEGGLEVSDAAWDRIMRINFMSHVWLARHLVPRMLRAGGGAMLQTVSAAGLLTQLGSAPYAVSKHAAMSFAEWLAITFGARGLKVFALCPQGVRTALLEEASQGSMNFLVETALEPAAVASAVIEGLASEKFLILPHPDVAEYFRRKGADYDRWLRGMQRLQKETGIEEIMQA
ncbi:MAG: SDR family oxidoreductase [Bryobacteraceae bacterium]|nr:SDR family oxidoreductase [Bryobacteraceae bacterium]